jgi:peptidyl-prolyl cis-trans isomerase C
MLYSARASARLTSASMAALALSCGLALAQAAPPAAAAPAAVQGDPVLAKVNGQPIHLSDLKDAAQTLPPNARGMPEQVLFPMLLDQLIDGRALLIEARKTGLDKDPEVLRQTKAAADQVLQSAMLSKQVGPSITEAAVKARYDQEIAGKPGAEEVHAKHILVDNEADAKKIIADLGKGGDFAALAKQYSKDTTAAAQGGDLGFFKKDEMVPEFATAAFALQPGQVSQTPVHTQFGWHVIQVIERRQAPAPTFEQSQDELRQKLIHEGVKKAVAQARADVTVEKFNPDGSPVRATDQAAPPAK